MVYAFNDDKSKNNLANVATSGNYGDLNNVPSVHYDGISNPSAKTIEAGFGDKIWFDVMDVKPLGILGIERNQIPLSVDISTWLDVDDNQFYVNVKNNSNQTRTIGRGTITLLYSYIA